MIIADRTVENIAAIQNEFREFSTMLDRATTKASFSGETNVRDEGKAVLSGLTLQFSEMFDRVKRPEYPTQVRPIQDTGNVAIDLHSVKYHLSDLAHEVLGHYALRAQPEAQREFIQSLSTYSISLRNFVQGDE